ncbi:NAD(P)-binding domain-containing protein [Streptomyces atroolivaceus]|uniref:hypothetical protein n=1 Tax=Streptomyces atroolivaceus TaxID=66869 RepID=UPI00369C8818
MAPDPRHQEGNPVVFPAGDDESAKAPFTRLLTEFGFAPVYFGALRAKAGRSCSSADR